jgi:hypothetical protein
MKTIRIMAIAVLSVGGGLALNVARTQQAGIRPTDHATGSTHGAPLRETVTVVANVPIPNLPGKRLVSRVIDSPLGRPRPRTDTPARLSSTPTSSRTRSGARSMMSLLASTGPVRRGSRAPAPTIR